MGVFTLAALAEGIDPRPVETPLQPRPNEYPVELITP
jgi:hypothetical protein